MLVLTTQARHPLHQLLGIPYLDLLQTEAHFHFFAQQPRRHGVGIVLHADRAAPPHPHAQPLQRLQPLARERPQLSQLLGHRGRPAGIPLRLHGTHHLQILLAAGEIPAATQQQGLLHRLLEMPMRRLHVAILMAAGRVGRLGVQAVMGQ